MNMGLAPAHMTLPASVRLARIMGARETLRAPFAEVWRQLGARHSPVELDVWAVGVLQLVDVNAGPNCLLAFWRVSTGLSRRGLEPLVLAASNAAEICRHAGAKAATATLEAYPAIEARLGTAPERVTWWRAMGRLAREAPESVIAVAAHMHMLAGGGADDFEAFIAAGLKAAGGDRARRLAFFALEDPAALQLLDRIGAGPGFAELEPKLKMLLTALWGEVPNLQPLPAPVRRDVPRRTGIAGSIIRLPEVFPGVRGEASKLLYRAAATHAAAHLAHGGPRMKVGKARPSQIAFANIIEDARVETLAMRRFPGLRRLWTSFHVAEPSDLPMAASLLERLARALFDPSYRDTDALIEKGRSLFVQADLDDPAISLDIGTRLANDLGQRRVRFDARGHVVEPAYRDDGLGLWDFGEQDPSTAEMIEVAVDSVRIERREMEDGPPDEAAEQRPAIGHARLAQASERGTVLATYPEWDEAEGIERPDWTIVRAMTPTLDDPRGIERALERAAPLRARIARLVRAARVGRAARLKRQAEGHDLDLDAVIEAAIAQRSGQAPDPQVFRSSALLQRDLSVMVLIDVSQSTSDRLKDGSGVLDVEKLAVAMLAEVMAGLGDTFALHAFASSGRDDVRITRVKGFDEPYGREAMATLAGLNAGLSTRLGAVLRHAGAEIAPVRSFRKLILVLTDGEPSDIDVSDPRDLMLDARRAVLGLRARGIDTFGVTLDPTGAGSGPQIFGKANAMPVRRVEDLPMRLSELYFRLARR